LPALAADLVGRHVALIVTYTDAAALAAKAATTTIPIVFVNGGDPVRPASFHSLNRPGDNITGVSFYGVDLAPKQLSLLHELVPKAEVVGLLIDQNVPDAVAQVPGVQDVAQSLGLQLIVLKAGVANDIDAAFQTLGARTRRCTPRWYGRVANQQTQANHCVGGTPWDSHDVSVIASPSLLSQFPDRQAFGQLQ
jgi:putative ABC transport system substrate-binding protein